MLILDNNGPIRYITGLRPDHPKMTFRWLILGRTTQLEKSINWSEAQDNEHGEQRAERRTQHGLGNHNSNMPGHEDVLTKKSKERNETSASTETQAAMEAHRSAASAVKRMDQPHDSAGLPSDNGIDQTARKRPHDDHNNSRWQEDNRPEDLARQAKRSRQSPQPSDGPATRKSMGSAEETTRIQQRECNTCQELKNSDEFPVRPATNQCRHTVQICKACTDSWLQSELDRKGCKGMKCPECPQILKMRHIKRIASPRAFNMYSDAATKQLLSEQKGFAWCLKRGCGSGQFNDHSRERMVCVACHHDQCLRHRCVWHEGETCEQYDSREDWKRLRAMDQQSTGWVKAHTKACPANCGRRMEKNEGCNHMTCKCGHEFYWRCLCPWVRGQGHRTTCRHYKRPGN